MGATLRGRCPDQSLPTEQQLGMKEGFDVGLEMSGNPQAFRDMLANMCHGGKIAMLGISRQSGDRLEHRRFQHAHDQRHLRPRDVRDLVQDDRDAAIGLDIRPSSRTASATPNSKGLEPMKSGNSGKVVL